MTSLRDYAEHGALIACRDDLCALVVSGPDRISWLMGMLTCDLSPVEHGQSVYGLVLDKQGKILADLVAMQHDEQLALAVDARLAGELQERLDHFLIMEDADIAVLERPHGFLLALGPRAGHVGSSAMGMEHVSAARPGRIWGTDAVLILVEGESAAPLAQGLADTDPDFGIAGPESFDAVRVELGIPKFGVDFGPANYPMDAGLDEHAISFSKGCYVGQEVVIKLRSRGKPVRVLRRLLLPPGARVPELGASVITLTGKEAGTVTSCGKTDTGSPVAYAMLRRADVESAEHLVVDGQEASLAPAWGLLGAPQT